jgi:hypothetical protein
VVTLEIVLRVSRKVAVSTTATKQINLIFKFKYFVQFVHKIANAFVYALFIKERNFLFGNHTMSKSIYNANMVFIINMHYHMLKLNSHSKFLNSLIIMLHLQYGWELTNIRNVYKQWKSIKNIINKNYKIKQNM